MNQTAVYPDHTQAAHFTQWAGFAQWREQRIEAWKELNESLIPSVGIIANPAQLSAYEKHSILGNCQKYNLSFYRFPDSVAPTKPILLNMWAQLGLTKLISNPCSGEDDITEITIAKSGEVKTPYIPYTNKALGWHTDGYYNTDQPEVMAFAMHCIMPSAVGGENVYYDPDILYIKLYDENPDYITALEHPQTFTIPADPNSGRPACQHPVFSYRGNPPRPYMRYSERKHNITWRQDETTQSALEFIRQTLANEHSDTNRPLLRSYYHIHRKLSANEGVICNNVLHKRTAFEHQDPRTIDGRLIYRARGPARIGY